MPVRLAIVFVLGGIAICAGVTRVAAAPNRFPFLWQGLVDEMALRFDPFTLTTLPPATARGAPRPRRPARPPTDVALSPTDVPLSATGRPSEGGSEAEAPGEGGGGALPDYHYVPPPRIPYRPPLRSPCQPPRP